jgi:hypothetical protein
MARYDDDDGDHIDMRPLLRLTVWGACAVVAVGATVMAGRTDVGTARAKVAIAALRAAPGDVVNHPSDMLASRPAVPDENEKRLVEEVRTLTADRDRLAERVASLEHSLADLTGSIARAAAANNASANASAANAAPPAQEKADAPPPAAAAPASAEPQVPPINFTGSSNDDQAAAAPAASTASAAPQPGVGLPADVPLPRPGPLATIQSYVNSTSPIPAAPPQTQTRVVAAHVNEPLPQAAANGFAIDLGSATNINTLRAHWGSVRAGHSALVAGLQPLVSVRQSTRPGFTEFHLVAGPVADADAAARLCAALTSVRVPCRPSVFNGQRLDLR